MKRYRVCIPYRVNYIYYVNAENKDEAENLVNYYLDSDSDYASTGIRGDEYPDQFEPDFVEEVPI